MYNDNAPRLILASGSASRKRLLMNAGLTFDVVPADVNEDEITAAMMSESDCVEAADIAANLAAEKAIAISQRHDGAYVIGSDQVLALGRRFIAKAATAKEARQTLVTLRGREHELVSAVAVARHGDVLWHGVDSATMSMRAFSDQALDAYLTQAGDAILGSVGCYHYEGLGVQLFDRVEGDHFTIQGLPLLPLLAFLRERGIVQS
jgi:septum formation protein